MNFEENTIKENQLPQFLKVLCILTFIGTGLGILFNIFGFLALNMTHAFNVAMMEAAAKSGEVLDPETLLFNTKVTLLTGIFTSIGCLIGAIFMWKLHKIGFTIYTISQACYIVFPILFPMTAELSLSTFLWPLIPVAFVIMYAINLKHMK